MSSLQLVNDAVSAFNGDLAVVNNSLVLVDGADAIRQHLQVRFGLFLGEWFLDEELGVPWFRDVLVKNPSFIVVQETLKGVVLDTPGVLELEQFSFEYDNATRVATLDFRCLTTEGFIDFSQEVEVGGGA